MITIRRFQLSKNLFPPWPELTAGLCDMRLTTDEKIEEVNNALQVYITISFAYVIM